MKSSTFSWTAYYCFLPGTFKHSDIFQPVCTGNEWQKQNESISSRESKLKYAEQKSLRLHGERNL